MAGANTMYTMQCTQCLYIHVSWGTFPHICYAMQGGMWCQKQAEIVWTVSNSHANLSGRGSDIDSRAPDWPEMAGANTMHTMQRTQCLYIHVSWGTFPHICYAMQGGMWCQKQAEIVWTVSNSHANLSGRGSDIDSRAPDWPEMAGANAIQSTVMHGQVPQPRLPTECWYICWYNAMQGALLCKQNQISVSIVV